MRVQKNLFGETISQDPRKYEHLFAFHKYWGKKDPLSAKRFILKYSKEDDIVLDCFSGSGVFVIQTIINHRKAIGIDLNPISSFIIENTLSYISQNSLKEAFFKIKKKCMRKIKEYYITYINGEKRVADAFIYGKKGLKEIWVSLGQKREKKVPDKKDLALLNSIMPPEKDTSLFKEPLFNNTRIKTSKYEYISDFFTDRNLTTLLLLKKTINSIQAPEIRNSFLFIFSAILSQCSKLVNHPKSKDCVGSWTFGLWTPNEYVEQNIWNVFRRKYKELLKIKKRIAYLGDFFKKAHSINELMTSNRNLFLKTSDIIQFLKSNKSQTFDYIILDPPHENRIPYLELSTIWNYWLDLNVNYDDEIIVSNSDSRDKDLEDYKKRLTICISESFRTLKEKGYITFIFNTTDDNIFSFLLSEFSNYSLSTRELRTFNYTLESQYKKIHKKGLNSDIAITFQKTKDKKRIDSCSLLEKILQMREGERKT
jgi:16S rRNA G966 N2-methylase RsmD